MSDTFYKLTAVCILLGALAFAGVRLQAIGYNRGQKDERAVWQLAEAARAASIEQDRIKMQEAADQIDREAQDRLEAEQKRADTLQEKLDAERRKNRAYRDCVVPADGVRIYTEAIRPARPN